MAVKTKLDSKEWALAWTLERAGVASISYLVQLFLNREHGRIQELRREAEKGTHEKVE